MIIDESSAEVHAVQKNSSVVSVAIWKYGTIYQPLLSSRI